MIEHCGAAEWHIRPLTPSDLDAAVAATAQVGWGNLRPHFAFYLEQPGCYPLVAEIEEKTVGTAAGTRRGSVGWIGHVIVQTGYRRRGIGSALVEAVIARLEEAGCRTLLLIATDLGRPVYERLGFRVDSLYCKLSGPTLDAHPTHPDLRRVAESDLPAIRALDQMASGEDRSATSAWQPRAAGSSAARHRGRYVASTCRHPGPRDRSSRATRRQWRCFST
jgi:GNAT superfamily N-acetyltransferase